MPRGTVSHELANDLYAIAAVGVPGVTLADLSGQGLVDSVASSILGRVVIFTEGAVQTDPDGETVVAVFGIEPGDLLISVTKVRSELALAHTAAVTTGVATLVFEDVLLGTAITDYDEVTLSNTVFEPDAGLILVYADLTVPNFNE